MSTNENGNNGDAPKVSDADVRSIGGNVSGGGPSPESEPGSVVSGAVAPPPAQLKKADFVSGQEAVSYTHLTLPTIYSV